MSFSLENQLDSNQISEDLLGFSCCALVMLCVTAIPFVNLFGVVANMEPTAYLLDDLLPPAEYRELSTILLVFAVRIIITLPCVIEIMRQLTFLLLSGVVLIQSTILCLKRMAEDMKCLEEFLGNFLAYKIAFRYLEHASSSVILVLLTTSYWSIVGLIWICINAYGKL